MCFSPQRRAIFRHRHFQNRSEIVVFCAFWLANVLFATAACNFWCHLSAPTSAPAALTGLLLSCVRLRLRSEETHKRSTAGQPNFKIRLQASQIARTTACGYTCGHRQHTISNRVNACGQKRHTSCDKNYFPSKLTNQTGQKRHSYLHTVCVLQPVQPFTPDKFEDILDAFTERRDTQAAIKRVSHRSSRIKPVRRDTVIFTPSVCSNLSSHSHRTSSKTS